MGSEGRRTGRRPHGEYVCPACGQPVGTVIKRRKVLGAFVPEWVPEPCRNPDCVSSTEKPDGETSAGSTAGSAV
ncbi:hypothetical protein [Streptomyces sp. NPDC000410]|uniref:hypothetical protein n=1 Tax=Streptomyces sp. NPDC000410 TaxID=3154254 RepID=UPI003319B2DC